MSKPYSLEEVATIAQMFYQYKTLAEISKTLERSEGSLVQKVIRLGLTRNSHTVRMVSVYGPMVLAFGTQPADIKRAMNEIKAQDKDLAKAEKLKTQQIALVGLRANLGRMPRNEAIRKAYAAGALIRQIAEVVKLSRAAVGFILVPPRNGKPPPPWTK